MTALLRLITITAIILFTACSKEQVPKASLLVSGKYTVINYWAEWCKPCREEIPELNKLALNYQDKAVVYAINFDGVSGDKLGEIVASFGIEYESKSIQDGQSLGIPSPLALPTTVIFAPDGSLKATLVGPQTAQSLAQYF